ncbi:MAG: SPOR domain-containing protein [Rhodospirillales bacterium]|nr:SPOR domain-containing protein [Rhodospirillales bacterium]
MIDFKIFKFDVLSNEGIASKFGLSIIVAIFLASCSSDKVPVDALVANTDKNIPGGVWQSPAPIPTYTAGDRFVYASGGKLITETVTKVSATSVEWSNDEGKSWTAARTPHLAPLREGVIVRTVSPGAQRLFPLAIDNYVRFGVTNTSPGNTPKQSIQTCQVLDDPVIKVSAGEFKTFEIFCRRDSFFETLYFAPAIGHFVLQKRSRGFRSMTKELVSFTTASPTMRAENTPPLPMAAVTLTPPVQEQTSTRLGAENSDVSTEKSAQKFELKRIPKMMPPETEAAGQIGVQIGAFRTKLGAKRAYENVMLPAVPNILGALKVRYLDYAPPAGGRKWVRILVGRFKSEVSARKLCRQLKAQNLDCWMNILK